MEMSAERAARERVRNEMGEEGKEGVREGESNMKRRRETVIWELGK